MGENLGNHGGMLDGGNDRQGAAALRAVFHIDLEQSFTKALPGFRPSGRRSPFKTAPGGFVSRGVSSWGQAPREGATQRGPLRRY